MLCDQTWCEAVAVAREIARDALRLARELVDAKVDVIMAVGDEAIVAAKNATPTIPIVMVACDAVTTGFVVSLARPDGNLTGLYHLRAPAEAPGCVSRRCPAQCRAADSIARRRGGLTREAAVSLAAIAVVPCFGSP